MNGQTSTPAALTRKVHLVSTE